MALFLALTLSMYAALSLHSLAVTTLQQRHPIEARERKLWAAEGITRGLVTIFVGVLVVLISTVVIRGKLEIFEPIRLGTVANLQETDLSTRPENWWEDPKQLTAVKGVFLAERNLASVNARRAFLAKADLRRANLQNADLFEADIRAANLREADLTRANLSFAKLRMSYLVWASLRSANLHAANLEKANLGGANLQNANLKEANLDGANLQRAILRGAALDGADLEGANLQGADLREAKGLTKEQLDEACGDEDTKLPEYLKDYKLKPCPKKGN